MRTTKVTMRISQVEATDPSLNALAQRTKMRGVLKGEKVPDRFSFSELREWPTDVWLLDSPLGPEAKLREHVGAFALIIQDHELHFQDLRDQGAKIEILCTITTDEFITTVHIPSSLAIVFCRMGIEIGLTITNLKGVPQSV